LDDILERDEQKKAVKRQYDSDLEDNEFDADDDDEPSSSQQCQELVYPCFEELAPYFSASNTEEVLRNTPLRTQCRTAVSVRNCIREAIESPTCSSHFGEGDKDILQFLGFIGGIIEFVCEDKLDEFERQQTCLRAAKFDANVEECRVENLQADKCNPARFVTCTNQAIDATPECAPGTDAAREAKELVAEFVQVLISFVPECEVPGMKMLLKFQKRMLK
jgi:hypothetical protein